MIPTIEDIVDGLLHGGNTYTREQAISWLYQHLELGATLRDHFAAAALQGFLASWPQDGANMVERMDKVSMMCFKFADAMLTEREKEAGE